MMNCDKDSHSIPDLTNSDEIRLDKCPFCGSENIAIHGATSCYSICLDCEATTGCFPSRRQAAEAWNRRADNG